MTKKIDIWIVISLVGLVLFSLFTILGIDHRLFVDQLIFFLVGFIFFAIANRMGVDFLRLNSFYIYIAFIGVLLFTFFFGDVVRGSRRWISFYFFNVQPSEFFRPFFLLFLADLLASRMEYFRKTVISFCIFFVPFLIILLQPDLGSSLVYVGTYVAVLFFAGMPARYFIKSVVIGAIASPLLWNMLHEYQKQRLTSFINPEAHAQDLSYNLIQSIITVGSGAFFGRGLGLGTQSRFRFLPENHTDFAFASLVEQFGFVGGFCVIVLFAILVYRLLRKARRVRTDHFRFLFMMGTILFILLPVFINIGMNLGMLPVTGITLPLISYGGSSIVSTLILIGLALSI